MTASRPDLLPRRQASCSGFSLLELLVVMAIMGIMLYQTVPAISSLQESNNLTFAGQSVIDTFAVARQYAASRNQSVSIRFITSSASTTLGYKGYDVVQIWKTDPVTLLPVASERMIRFPTGIEISSDATLSPLVAAGGGGLVGTSSNMPAGSIAGSYVQFSVRPDGNIVVSNPPTGEAAARQPRYFLTLLPPRYDSSSALPKNYITVQVNPDTANTSVFRP